MYRNRKLKILKQNSWRKIYFNVNYIKFSWALIPPLVAIYLSISVSGITDLNTSTIVMLSCALFSLLVYSYVAVKQKNIIFLSVLIIAIIVFSYLLIEFIVNE